MAYKDKTAERLAGRIRQRTFRERKAKARGMPTVVDAEIQDSALALAEWAASKLVVPPGHPLAGQPMVMPDFGIAFIRDALAHRRVCFAWLERTPRAPRLPCWCWACWLDHFDGLDCGSGPFQSRGKRRESC